MGLANRPKPLRRERPPHQSLHLGRSPRRSEDDLLVGGPKKMRLHLRLPQRAPKGHISRSLLERPTKIRTLLMKELNELLLEFATKTMLMTMPKSETLMTATWTKKIHVTPLHKKMA